LPAAASGRTIRVFWDFGDDTLIEIISVTSGIQFPDYPLEMKVKRKLKETRSKANLIKNRMESGAILYTIYKRIATKKEIILKSDLIECKPRRRTAIPQTKARRRIAAAVWLQGRAVMLPPVATASRVSGAVLAPLKI